MSGSLARASYLACLQKKEGGRDVLVILSLPSLNSFGDRKRTKNRVSLFGKKSSLLALKECLLWRAKTLLQNLKKDLIFNETIVLGI